MKNIDEQLKIIKRGIVELLPEKELAAKLAKGRPLRVKFGADPSAPDIHLGHTVILNKLRQFQDLGHEVIFIIGDFTALIGDPTGKSETRKPLSREEIKSNARTYQQQAFKILDKSRTEIVFNSDWLSKLKIEEVVNLAAKQTVARMLERDDFSKRYKEGRPISIHEFLYPLFQGYDSVYLKSDIEVGGTDQKFNMLVGRELQREFKVEPQVILTLSLLEGTDGVQKMSKSLGNYIGITEGAGQIFGKVMSISDELMLRYYELLTDKELETIKLLHPKEAKSQLAKILTARFYGEEFARKAADDFAAVFSQGQRPFDIELKYLSTGQLRAVELLKQSGLAASGAEARRIIQQRGFKIDDQVIVAENQEIDVTTERLLQKGKRFFLRVKKK
ncbi:tyrosine--tRNA ligase [Candidatus Saganbacteria bacterium]|nr:tyrosine--tRNA ligase [Candidatus Saganbacteria bacterium]